MQNINDEYEKALHSQTITAELRIDIKEYFSNLRSILDYIAHDIVEKFCPKANPKNKLYFPIRDDIKAFISEMTKSYPGLELNNKNIFDILENVQHFKKDDNKWLFYFNKINNEHKHDKLVPQIRKETKKITISRQGGGSVSWGAGVKFGSGVNVMGIPIDPNTQLPIPNNIVKTEIITWVDFHFEGINISAIWLVKESFKQINKIYDHLKSEI